MRSLRFAALLSVLGCLPACVSMRVGPDDEFLRVRGLAHAHGSFDGLDDYDGSILDVGILTNTRGGGELVSVELGPLAGVGVGLFGARARVLPLELGVGLGFYDPRPRRTRDRDDARDDREYYRRGQKEKAKKPPREPDDHERQPEPRGESSGGGESGQ